MSQPLRKRVCHECGLAFEEEDVERNLLNGACPRCGVQLKAPTTLPGYEPQGEPLR